MNVNFNIKTDSGSLNEYVIPIAEINKAIDLKIRDTLDQTKDSEYLKKLRNQSTLPERAYRRTICDKDIFNKKVSLTLDLLFEIKNSFSEIRLAEIASSGQSNLKNIVGLKMGNGLLNIKIVCEVSSLTTTFEEVALSATDFINTVDNNGLFFLKNTEPKRIDFLEVRIE